MHLILLHGQEPALKAAQIPIPEGVSPAEASDAGDVYNENTIYIYIYMEDLPTFTQKIT